VHSSSRRMVTTWTRRGRKGGGDVRGAGRPMARDGAVVQRVRARRVAPAKVHLHHTQERKAQFKDRRSQPCLGMRTTMYGGGRRGVG
jgi:hypothetical protein